MKKDLLTHFIFMLALFILVSMYRGWIDLIYISFWVGGILGTLLPDVDHLFYAYLLHPEDSTSQQITSLISQKKVIKTWDTIATTRTERKDLLFHTVPFQIIFTIFALFVLTSSDNLLGIGVVVAFMLHLLVDQFTDLLETKNIDNWFQNFPLTLDASQKKYYLYANGIVLLIFSFFL